MQFVSQRNDGCDESKNAVCDGFVCDVFVPSCLCGCDDRGLRHAPEAPALIETECDEALADELPRAA